MLAKKACDNGMNEAEYIRLLISQKPNDYVAVYVGNGKVVEALNESLGVVYRDVASTGKIVVIGRP